MTTALEEAFPAGDVANATQIAKLAEQGIIVVDDLDAVTAEDFSIQPWAGICSLADGSLFMYDATDTTSTHDGMTVIVVSGRRYILRTTQIFDGRVASAGDTSPPASPSLGDAYIIGAAPSGDWASYAKYIAKWTARGWVYRAPAQGMVFWVIDEQTYYHYASDDTWTQGLPVTGIADGSISPIKFSNPLAVMPIEDERATPPASLPGAGTAYIVASSPTGAFVGYTGYVARSNGTDYDFIAPFEGATVYNRDISALYSYKSGAWTSSTTPSAAQNYWIASGSGSSFTQDTTPIIYDTIAAQGAAGNYWVVDLILLTLSSSTVPSPRDFEIRVYLDSESTAKGVVYKETVDTSTGLDGLGVHYRVAVDVPDAAAHDIHIKGYASNNINSVSYTVQWDVQEWQPTA